MVKKRINIENIHEMSTEDLAKAFKDDAIIWSDSLYEMDLSRERSHKINSEMLTRSEQNEYARFQAMSYPDAWDREGKLNSLKAKGYKALMLAQNIKHIIDASQHDEPLDMQPLLDILGSLADE